MDRTLFLDLDRASARRQFAGEFAMRAAEGDPDKLTFDGYASITEFEYPMLTKDGSFPGWRETITAGAFKRTLRNKADVVFKINHGGIALARTAHNGKPGTMKLAEDETGLHTLATLDRRVQAVADLELLSSDHVIDEMSFAFWIEKEEWFDDDGEPSDWMNGTVRHITEVNLNKGDVSAVNYGANPATSGGFRAFDMAFDALQTGRALTPEQTALVRSLLETEPAPPDDDSAEQAHAVARLMAVRSTRAA